jgi:hypothetical protein
MTITMEPDIQQLREWIAANKIEMAIRALIALTKDAPIQQQEVIALSSAYNDLRKKEHFLLSLGESNIIKNQLTVNLLNLIDRLTQKDLPAARVPKRSVFISYNHGDTAVANQLQQKLMDNHITVLIDNKAIRAGEDIQQFIEKSVKETDVTLSIISKNSLLSAWVAMETINTFYLGKMNTGKKFIACYIENDFFNRSFTDNALDIIDNQLREIEKIRTVRMEKGRNTRDLNNEYTRLKELANGMDEIVRRLRECVCLDIGSDEKLEANLQMLVHSIQS